MMRALYSLFIGLIIGGAALAQDDGLNLPTELYVLTNSGQVQQYGLGISGVRPVTPEGEFVLDFGIAPDGNWLAYRTETALTFQDIYEPENALPIEGASAGIPPVRGQGDTIAWSPAGDAVAYTTIYGTRVAFNGGQTFLDLGEGGNVQLLWSPNGAFLAAEAADDIWWIYRREAASLALHAAIPSAVGLAWAGDAVLVFAPAEGGLIRMDLANANAQTALLDDTWNYALPFLAADGRLAVFGRQKDDDTIEPGQGRLLALTPALTESQSLGETGFDLNGLRWAPRADFLIAFRGGVMALVIPATGQGLALPVSDAVAYSWGPPPLEVVSGIEMTANGYFTAGGAEGTRQVWRIPANGSAPELLTEAAADVTAFAPSPDESSIVYGSAGQLWRQVIGGAAQSLDDLNGRDPRDITFNPDGSLIAFATFTSPDQPEGGLWRRGLNDEAAALAVANGQAGAPPFYRMPQFALNIQALMVMELGGETSAFKWIDAAGVGSPPVDVGPFDGAIWLRDGRILAYGNGIGIGDPPPTQPIFVYNPADSIRTEIGAIALPERVVTLREIAPGIVRFITSPARPGPRPLSVFDLDLSTGTLTPGGGAGFVINPVLSPEGRFLAGQARPNGPLTVRDLTTGRQVIILDPPDTADFTWG